MLFRQLFISVIIGYLKRMDEKKEIFFTLNPNQRQFLEDEKRHKEKQIQLTEGMKNSKKKKRCELPCFSSSHTNIIRRLYE